MTAEVLHSPSHFPSSPSSSLSCADGAPQTHTSPVEEERKERDKEGDQLSLLALLLTVFRKSLVSCRTLREEKLCSMEISWPTNVRHVAHVTFDRFHGFLGLPVEFEPEVPRRAPSASASVFGVSTESMQCSYDSRGNSVPTILLLMQRRLYAQGGLQAEGIFRINAENSQEEFVRDQLNRGIVPDGIDLHCLAGLIKAWFRELPSGVLDPLEPEQVMQSQSEEACAQLVRFLPPTEAALLDWAINLMADVVQEEHQNKMNARNIAMVFAPNMTQMSDPLTALMYAVQVMNFLKTLIIRRLKEREDTVIESAPNSNLEPSDENGYDGPPQPCVEEASEVEESEGVFIADEPASESSSHSTEADTTAESGVQNYQNFTEKPISDEPLIGDCSSEMAAETDRIVNGTDTSIVDKPKPTILANALNNKIGQASNSNLKKGARKLSGPPVLQPPAYPEKSRGISIISRINSRTEWVEAWR